MQAGPEPTAAAGDLLRKSGIRPTRQRCLITGILFEKPQHLSAEQVVAAVRARGARVSRATVYNTLNLLVEHGLLHPVVVNPNKVFYDSNARAHFHFYNEDSGELSDFPQDGIRISGMPQLPPDTRAAGVDVIVRVRNRIA
jgi:Fur family iron response transcriptional regulator